MPSGTVRRGDEVVTGLFETEQFLRLRVSIRAEVKSKKMKFITHKNQAEMGPGIKY